MVTRKYTPPDDSDLLYAMFAWFAKYGEATCHNEASPLMPRIYYEINYLPQERMLELAKLVHKGGGFTLMPR